MIIFIIFSKNNKDYKKKCLFLQFLISVTNIAYFSIFIYLHCSPFNAQIIEYTIFLNKMMNFYQK